MGSLLSTNNLLPEEPASARSLTPTLTSEIKYGKLCGRDSCMHAMRRVEEVTSLPDDIVALCFDYSHEGVHILAHATKGPVSEEEAKRVADLIQERVLDPTKTTATVRNPIFAYFNEIRASETSKQARLEELCNALKPLLADDIACATELTKQLRDILKPILAETLDVDPRDIHEATEMAALSHVLSINEGIITALDAVTTNYIANLIAT